MPPPFVASVLCDPADLESDDVVAVQVVTDDSSSSRAEGGSDDEWLPRGEESDEESSEEHEGGPSSGRKAREPRRRQRQRTANSNGSGWRQMPSQYRGGGMFQSFNELPTDEERAQLAAAAIREAEEEGLQLEAPKFKSWKGKAVTSRFKGVKKCGRGTDRKPWQARLGAYLALGTYETEEQAALAIARAKASGARCPGVAKQRIGQQQSPATARTAPAPPPAMSPTHAGVAAAKHRAELLGLGYYSGPASDDGSTPDTHDAVDVGTDSTTRADSAALSSDQH